MRQGDTVELLVFRVNEVPAWHPLAAVTISPNFNHTDTEERTVKLPDDRQIIGFGASRTFHLCEPLLDTKLDFLVDNDSALWATKKNQASVCSPERLNELSQGSFFVVVFSAQYWDIERSLLALGLVHGRDYVEFAEIEGLKDVLLEIPLEKAYENLDLLLNPGDVCMDVGANAGIYSLRMAQIVGAGADGIVHALEPFPQTF